MQERPMARGRDRHDAHQAAVAGLGRSLSRRARNHCELCGADGSLKVVEVPPTFDAPDPERAAMFCERCMRAVEGGRGAPGPDELRFLAEAVWAEVLPVQLTAVRLARTLSAQGVVWATELCEGLYLDEDTEALL